MVVVPVWRPHLAAFDYPRVFALSLHRLVAVAHLRAPLLHRSLSHVAFAVVAHQTRCHVASPIAAHQQDADAHIMDPVPSTDRQSPPAVRCVQMSFAHRQHRHRSQRRLAVVLAWMCGTCLPVCRLDEGIWRRRKEGRLYTHI